MSFFFSFFFRAVVFKPQVVNYSFILKSILWGEITGVRNPSVLTAAGKMAAGHSEYFRDSVTDARVKTSCIALSAPLLKC